MRLLDPVLQPEILGPSSSPRRRLRPLRMVSFLAPKLLWFYQRLGRYLREQFGLPFAVEQGTQYDQLAAADFAFVCGLAYVEHERNGQAAVEPLAAPFLSEPRYQGRPIYFSDVIVRRDSSLRHFEDLRSRSWAYNEPHSQSGYGITRFHLVQRGETRAFFGRVVAAGWHERAIHMVARGEVDASAIDSQVLTLAQRDEPDLARRLRVIASLGPSTIQPLVAARRLPKTLRRAVRSALVNVGCDSTMRSALGRALVQGFVAVDAAAYDDIRHMQAAAEAADFRSLR